MRVPDCFVASGQEIRLSTREFAVDLATSAECMGLFSNTSAQLEGLLRLLDTPEL